MQQCLQKSLYKNVLGETVLLFPFNIRAKIIFLNYTISLAKIKK